MGDIGHLEDRSHGRSRCSRGKTRGVWVRFLRTVGMHALALADQAVVSGASFLATIVVSRGASPIQLGFYSIGISWLVSALGTQDSLVSLPYTIQRHHPLGTPSEAAGSSLAQSGLLSALAVVILVMAALGLSAHDAEPALVAMTWVLAVVAPFLLLREFGRAFAFAHLQMAQALILDIAVAAIQFAGLGWLAWIGWMSAATACTALGGACALTGAVWLYLARADFAIRRNQVRPAMERSWDLGKWLFAGQIAVSVQVYVTYWLLALGNGPTATGVYAACMSIVSFANPLISGFVNSSRPRAAMAFKEGGGPRLWRQAIQDSVLLGAVMTLFCTVVLFAGKDVMQLLYHGKEYEGQGQTITVLALAALVSAVGLPASIALASMERPRPFVWAGSVGVVVTVVLVWYLMGEWGLVGAAYGFLAGNVAGSVGRWVAFLVLVRRFGQKSRHHNVDPQIDIEAPTPG